MKCPDSSVFFTGKSEHKRVGVAPSSPARSRTRDPMGGMSWSAYPECLAQCGWFPHSLFCSRSALQHQIFRAPQRAKIPDGFVKVVRRHTTDGSELVKPKSKDKDWKKRWLLIGIQHLPADIPSVWQEFSAPKRLGDFTEEEEKQWAQLNYTNIGQRSAHVPMTIEQILALDEAQAWFLQARQDLGGYPFGEQFAGHLRSAHPNLVSMPP